jgi:hypothetical protein
MDLLENYCQEKTSYLYLNGPETLWQEVTGTVYILFCSKSILGNTKNTFAALSTLFQKRLLYRHLKDQLHVNGSRGSGDNLFPIENIIVYFFLIFGNTHCY